MTYHPGCVLTPFFCEIPEEVGPIFPALMTGGWLSGVGRRKGEAEAQDERRVERNERTVIRSCQRAATGRVRGQLPRNAPGISGVRGHAFVQMIISGGLL